MPKVVTQLCIGEYRTNPRPIDRTSNPLQTMKLWHLLQFMPIRDKILGTARPISSKLIQRKHMQHIVIMCCLSSFVVVSRHESQFNVVKILEKT